MMQMLGFGKQSRNVILAGVSGAGTTQLLYSLALQKAPEKAFEPTRGFNYEKVVHKINDRRTTTYELHIFDLAGDERLRTLWKHFYDNMNTHVLCFVIDAHDSAVLPQVRAEFQLLVHEEMLREAHLVIVQNIKDKRRPIIDDAELSTALELKKFRYLKPVLCKVNAKEGTGLDKLRKVFCLGAEATAKS
jgi:small GTP-binding protein